MKHILLSFALILSLLCGLSTPAFAASDVLHLTAHRGYSSVAPENTLAAAREAGKAGFYGCEFDIQTTADHVWVVFHDDTLSRVTDGTGRVSDMTLQELSAYPITKGSGVDCYPDESIPTLEQMLDECLIWGLHPVIEIKGNDTAYIPALCEFLEKRPEKNNFTVISFSREILTAVREVMPRMRCLYLTENITQSDLSFCQDAGLTGISPDFSLLDWDMAEQAQEQGLLLWVWVVDDLEGAKRCYDAGITELTTNSLSPDLESEITGKTSLLQKAFKRLQSGTKKVRADLIRFILSLLK